MQVKLLILNKYSQSIDSAEISLRRLVQEHDMGVEELQVYEAPHNGNIHFLLTFKGPRRPDQDIGVLGWLDANEAERVLNSNLEQIVADHKTARLVRLVPTTKSPRMLAAFIVERATSEASNQDIKAEERTQKQDPLEAPEPKPSRQRKPRG